MTTHADATGVDALTDEAALVERARGGERAAWEQLYERCYAPIYRYARGRVFDATAAEDIAAEVFVAAVRDIGRYRQQGKPILAWLFGIAAHAVADYQRAFGRQRRLHERLLPFGGPRHSGRVAAWESSNPGFGPFTTTGEDEAIALRLDLAQAIERLTPVQREVMILRYFVGFSTSEIAAVIGKDTSAVYSLHARALVALRGQLSQKDLPARDESRPSRAISHVEAELR